MVSLRKRLRGSNKFNFTFQIVEGISFTFGGDDEKSCMNLFSHFCKRSGIPNMFKEISTLYTKQDNIIDAKDVFKGETN